MTMTVTLNGELEQRIEIEAKLRGLSAEAVLLEVIEHRWPNPHEESLEDGSLADALAEFIGAVEGSPESFTREGAKHLSGVLPEEQQKLAR